MLEMLTVGESKKAIPLGNINFLSVTTPKDWIVPQGVTEISVVCVGAGGPYQTNSGTVGRRGGAGGDLGYRNKIPVTPGETLTVAVQNNLLSLSRSSQVLCCAGQPTGPDPFTGQYPTIPDLVINKGGAGGENILGNSNKGAAGAGGAAGYSGSGGKGGTSTPASTTWSAGAAGQGGGGGGGWGYYFSGSTSGENSCGGGGVGIAGQGANGAGSGGGNNPTDSKGGSGGGNGTLNKGGTYGGGAGHYLQGSTPGNNAVRVIWGTTEERSFPLNARIV